MIGVILVVVFVLLLYVSSRKPNKFPPGPARLPIIGHMVKGSLPDPKLSKFGNLVGMYLGNFPAVQIQDFQLAKELFNKEEWSGRGRSFVTRYLRADNGENKGIITTEGAVWVEQRRFALKHLKDFGFGRAGLEGVIQDEAEELVKFLHTQVGKDFKMETVFGVPVINILWIIVAGKRFQSEDPLVQRTLTLLTKLFKSKLALEYILSWWGIIAYCIPGLDTRKRIIRELRQSFRNSIEEHRASLDPNHPRDFIDIYLLEMQKGTKNFDQEQLELVCLDLFKAGAETSSTTLLWCVLYLTQYSEVQEKCYDEISSQVGEERPSLKHSLPYCQAVIQEIQRLAAVAPQSIPHRVTQSVKLGDYIVPENSLATANLVRIMRDPNYWEEPDMFRPERFLETTLQGLKLVRREQFVPFGLGRRICMGESLARDTLFIFFTTLVQHFRFNKPANHPAPDTNNFTDGFTLIPHPFWVKMTARQA